MIPNLLALYKTEYPFDKFYDNLLFNIAAKPNEHIKSSSFLNGYLSPEPILQSTSYEKTELGDLRVDLPVWFGDSNATNRIVVIGMEPRDTDKSGGLNIEKKGKFVFATPFALEIPKGPYHSSFQELINPKDAFVFFTDVVKFFEVSGDKLNDDKNARKTFLKKAHEHKEVLLKELDIIQPTKIVALGNDSFNVLKKILLNTDRLIKVRHPSQGGAKIAQKQLAELLN